MGAGKIENRGPKTMLSKGMISLCPSECGENREIVVTVVQSGGFLLVRLGATLNGGKGDKKYTFSA